MSDTVPRADRSEAQERAAQRLREFRALRDRGALCTAVTEDLSTEAATAFLNGYMAAGEYLSDAIALLAEIATLEEPCLSQPGQRATFPLLIERLSDSFNPELCLVYDRAFAQMISHCRRLPAGHKLDAALNRFGLTTEHDLLERKARLRGNRTLHPEGRQSVRKVLVPSRVTLGADIAITSVVLEKAKRTFPNAERVLLGSRKAEELLGGGDGLRVREVRYETQGGLLERLENWFPVLTAVEEECRNLTPAECIMIDPDSRLLQLGMLPALEPSAEDSRYFFFESRRLGQQKGGSISRITLQWLNETFPSASANADEDEILPQVGLREQDRRFGEAVCHKLLAGGAKYLVAVSFGVGGNSEKSLGNIFEGDLLFALLKDGATIILDQGFGQEELDRAARLMEEVRAAGWNVLDLNSGNAPEVSASTEPLRSRLVAWRGGIGAFGALAGASHEYIGYDSAGQHIAAALGVPVVDIFGDAAAALFRERWRPSGPGIVKVICGERGDPGKTLSAVLAAHQEIRGSKQ